MSDRSVVSMNFISKGLKSGCRKNSVCISCARLLFCWRIRMSLKSQPDGLDQKLILMRQQKTIILRTYLIQK
jgi:hypothetical protein